ncbi:hypothetical protein DPMN_126219 [Dreissena polymorpha]|uniref:Uncharacterized protein n=1 Tax=Dreissena polymorpha TaxID=45954 RepID=A0A9D4GZR0_DREPO|nr:hypothetical protein DPMN_126219 [Dreissena polymorpha]
MLVVSTIGVITVTDVIRSMTLASQTSTGTTTGSITGIVMVQWAALIVDGLMGTTVIADR